MSKFFERFTLYELVVMAVMAALGIAIKPIVVPLAHIVCGPLMIPSGALAGGLYMMWLVIGYGLVKKPGTALIISVIQALLVIFTGIVGSHGIMSLLTYILPGLAVEIVMIIARLTGCKTRTDSVGLIGCSIAGLFANMTGTATVNIVFFQAPGVYLILILALSAASGLVGGVLAWQLIKIVSRFGGRQKLAEVDAGWIEDVDAVICEGMSETDDNAGKSEADDEHKKSRKPWKLVLVIACALVAVVGITAFINSSGDEDDDALTVLINGEPQATFSLKDVMKMESETQYVNLTSGKGEDAKGDYTGPRIETVLVAAGIEIDKAQSEYSAALITAGDGYSSAADMDEIAEVLIAYRLDGETLGDYENGGTGPLRAIFTEDTYGNRSVMNVVKIDLR